MSAKTLPQQRARCRTRRCAGAWWPISASSDAGVVELSARGLPAVLPPHLLAPLPAGERGTLADTDPGASNRRRDPGNAIPPLGLGRPLTPGRHAAPWVSATGGFLWMYYAGNNWTAIYFVPAFVGEGLL